MKNPVAAVLIFATSAAALCAVLLFPRNDHVNLNPPVKTAEITAQVDSDSTGRLPYSPPNPEARISQQEQDAETRSLLDGIPKQIQSSLIIEEPQLSTADREHLAGMVWVPGGTFVMGSRHGPPDEAPRHALVLDGFWMDALEVTNARFRKFVDATGYVTLPERKPELRSVKKGSNLDQLAILEEMNQPGSICSLPIASRNEIDARGAYSWWQYVPGASWKHPEGPESGITDRMDHPVVHVSWLDVQEYCRWAERTLPTEAQWEYAARGGHHGRIYPWGNVRQPNGKWLQNIWQGEFPVEDTGKDGHTGTAPVGSYESNDYGLYDMSGNVWEWCSDYYRPDSYLTSTVHNPSGPDNSWDPLEPDLIKRVQRGGSFMCSEQYCVGYRVASRMKGEEDTGVFHTGFRTVVTPDMIGISAD
ncbi:MAG: formylglycine-generating enzyme family protein [Fuerstiella sp.]|nr:formylglycine-generating enzyme family protein [Fuerstiella sp.]